MASLFETTLASLAAGGGGMAVARWLGEYMRDRAKARDNLETTRLQQSTPSAVIEFAGAMQRLAAEAVEDAVKMLRDENRTLRDDVALLKAEVRRLSDENETCQAENRDVKTQLSEFAAKLREHGIEVPAGGIPSDSYVKIEGRHASVEFDPHQT